MIGAILTLLRASGILGRLGGILKIGGAFFGGALLENRRQANARTKRTLKLYRRKQEIKHEIDDKNADDLRGSDYL